MTNITQTPAYRVAFSMYVALGGDKTRIFDSVEAIYAEIDKFYGKGSRITTEALIVNIGENGSELYNDDAITGYKPVRINVDVPQKYTDEQVEELKETSRQQGYDSGYDKGIADGYVQGESEGYTDGYAEGLEDGAEDQKALLEDITIRDNGVYEKEDGYNKVTVEIEKGIPEEELNAMLEEARNEGIETGVATQKAKLISTSITENGTYTREDGWNSVTIKVTGGGGDNIKPKIYNGFVLNTTGSSYTAPASELSKVDFSQYDWSNMYNLSYFFQNFGNNTSFTDEDFANFDANFNGTIMKCSYMFDKGSSNTCALTHVPAFLNTRMHDCIDASHMFEGLGLLRNADNIENWNTINLKYTNNMFETCSFSDVPLFDTSNVTNMSRMFYLCSNLTTVPPFDTSNVTTMYTMFSGCTNLTTIPEFDTSNVKNLASMLCNCNDLTYIPKLNFENVIYGNIFGSTTNNIYYLTDLGGFTNLGKTEKFSSTNFLSKCNNLTKESVMNVINNLYDRASIGYSTVSLKFHSNSLALLSDEEKAIATNKGFILTT